MTPLGEVPVLVVSPHYDDAVMSAFALLDGRTTVMNVFTGRPAPAVTSDWDTGAGFADSTDAMTARSIEDDRAFDGLGTTRIEVGLLDNQYATLASGAGRTADDAATLTARVADWLASNDGGAVAVPAGAGGPLTRLHRLRYHLHSLRFGLRGGGPAHPDHVWVTDHLAATLDPGVDVVLYEDLPYAWVKPADDRVATVAARTGRRATPFVVPVDVGRKAVAVERYASQLRGNVAPWVPSVAAALPTSERYWLLRS